MAWIEQRRRADGGVTARVFWRPGGCRDAPRVWETFGAGSDAQNLARADGFKRMVEAAGQRWPDGWVKGEGFVRPPEVADPMTPPPTFDKIGEEHVRQILDLSPGQRKRYLGQLQVLARTPVRGSLVFAGPVTAIGETQVKTPLPHIQARLGHESITTTIDTYDHLLPVGDELISRIIDTALTGGTIRPMSTP